mgnify:CR=1 FL=1
MSLTIRINNFALNHFSIFNLIQLKLLAVPEMLKNHAILISYCNFHFFILSFLIYSFF